MMTHPGLPLGGARGTALAARGREAAMTVAIRQDYTAAALRGSAKAATSTAVARRLLALAAVLEGESRREAARRVGMDRQTLRDWVYRFNAEGPAGLADRPRSGRRPRLDPARRDELAAIVERGPDPEGDGIVRWRLADLCAVAKDRFGAAYRERGMGKLLKRLGFARLSARPIHPKADPAAQEAFKKTSPCWRRRGSGSGATAGRSRSGSRTRPG
jgi:transposase